MARRLAREEGLGPRPEQMLSQRFKWWSGLGRDAKVVTLMGDSGLKYLSTDVYWSG